MTMPFERRKSRQVKVGWIEVGGDAPVRVQSMTTTKTHDIDATLQEIGEAHGKSAAQVALRWLVQQEKVSAIPKATGEDHLRANLDVFDFELSDEEMDRVSALGR